MTACINLVHASLEHCDAKKTPMQLSKPLFALGSLHGSESTMTAGGLRVLTTNTDAPVVTKTPVKADALHSLNVLGQWHNGKLQICNTVCKHSMSKNVCQKGTNL